MKILLLADPISSHTQKWANSLQDSGVQIAIFGLSRYDPNNYKRDIKIDIVDFSRSVKATRDGNILKSIYLTVIPKLKSLVRKYQPDIIHAHSASSYGFLGSLLDFHPFFISLWGSDVYLFPKKSYFHRKLFKFSLTKADKTFPSAFSV